MGVHSEVLSTEPPPARRWRGAGALAALVLVVALGGAGTAIALSGGGHSAGAARTPGSKSTTPSTSSTGSRSSTTTAPPAPVNVTSMTPAPGSSSVPFGSDVTVTFSEPLATSSPLPSLSPAPPGSWVRVDPRTVRFVPNGFFSPFAKVQITVPGGTSGVESALGTHLGGTLTNSFTVAGGSELRLQQLLAELDYLPVSFVPGTGTGTGGASLTAAASAISAEATVANQVSLSPVPGSFVWRFKNIPASLSALWAPGQAGVITTGAVMAFEAANGLATDGQAGPAVWNALLAAVAARHVTSAPYDYVYVSQVLPETTYLWRDGSVIFSSLANTGIPQSPTAVGTWPVYLRFTTTTMSGTNPDGSHYSDPGIPWVSYFNGGDALHGFIRASYGFPQSLGCIEMPFASAATLWPMTPLGTLVTIL